MLKVVSPVTTVGGSIAVSIGSYAVCFVSLPLSFVFVTVNMPERSLSVSFVVFPLTIVLCTVWPDLNSSTVSEIILPLTLVACSVFKYEFVTPFALTVVLLIRLLTVVVPVIFCIVEVIYSTLQVLRTAHAYTFRVASGKLRLLSIRMILRWHTHLCITVALDVIGLDLITIWAISSVAGSSTNHLKLLV